MRRISFREIESLAKDHTAGEYIAVLDRRKKGEGAASEMNVIHSKMDVIWTPNAVRASASNRENMI